MVKNARVVITVDSKYHRDQFDDWVAGGKVEYKGKTYHWSAQNSNYGFGWDVEPITEEDWGGLNENELNTLMKIIEKCLYKHKPEYYFKILFD